MIVNLLIIFVIHLFLLHQVFMIIILIIFYKLIIIILFINNIHPFIFTRRNDVNKSVMNNFSSA